MRRDDDLRLAIDRRHRGVALNHTLGCRHLGAVVVGDVALADRALLRAPFFVRSEELPDPACLGPQTLDPGA